MELKEVVVRVVTVNRPTDGKRMTLQLNGIGSFISEWEQSAQRAMQAEPLYFARWYTVKSIALVGVTATLVYMLVRKK